ncbi:MAG: OmpA family protein [Bernardetiaceae bacterium]|nr:OmpA family protein [Bernardetiaceae bacterium]
MKNIILMILFFYFCSISFAQEIAPFSHIATLAANGEAVSFIRFSPSGKYVATGDDSGIFVLWETASQQKIYQIAAHKDKITDICFSRDENLLATAAYDGKVKLWQRASGRSIKTFENPAVAPYANIKGYEPTFVALSPDAQKLYFGGYNRKVIEADLVGNEPLRELFSSDKYGITCGIISADEAFLVFGYGGEIAFLNLQSRQITHKIGQHGEFDDFVCEIAFSYTDNRLGVWTYSGRIDFYELEQRQRTEQLQATREQGSSEFAFSKDGRFILTGNSGRDVNIWHTQSRRKLQTLNPHSEKAIALDISSNGQYIATSDKNQVKIWSFRTPQVLPDTPPITIEFEGSPIQLNETIDLKLQFEQSKDRLLAESMDKLDKVATFLQQYQKVCIALEGHTDNIGNPYLNFQLSEARAKKARQYLIDKGISANRIEAKGFGAANPIAPNTDEQNRKINRRVEMRINKI